MGKKIKLNTRYPIQSLAEAKEGLPDDIKVDMTVFPSLIALSINAR